MEVYGETAEKKRVKYEVRHCLITKNKDPLNCSNNSQLH